MLENDFFDADIILEIVEIDIDASLGVSDEAVWRHGLLAQLATVRIHRLDGAQRFAVVGLGERQSDVLELYLGLAFLFL